MTRAAPILALVFALLAALAPAARAQRITVGAAVNQDRIYAGEPFAFFVVVEGASSAEPLRLDRIPELAALSPEELGGGEQSQSSITIDFNGQRRETKSLRYLFQNRLTAPAPGPLVIPAIPVVVAGKTYTTQPLTINVLAPLESDDFRLVVQVDKARLYVGEPVPVRFIWLRRVSEIRAPRFALTPSPFYDLLNPSEQQIQALGRGKQLYEIAFDKRSAVAIGSAVRFEGRDYEAITVEQILIPRQPGSLEIGPASVSCEVVTGRRRPSFFDGPFADTAVTQRYTASARPVPIEVLPLPEQGRPRAFSGLVGAYSIDASATPTTVHVGDPITLTIRISGPPPFDAIPDIRLEDQPELASSFRITPEGRPEITAEGKQFTATLRAKSESSTRIPSIELPFFDVQSGTYRTASSSPIELKVRPTREVTLADAFSSSPDDTGPTGRALESAAGGLAPNDESPGVLASQDFDLRRALVSPLGLASTLATPALALGAILLTRLRAAGAASAPARRRRRALPDALVRLDAARADPDAPSAVARAVAEFIAARCDLPPGALTASEAAEALRARRVDDAAARPALDVLERCDAARFAGLSAVEAGRLADDARDALRALARSLRARA